MYKEDLALNNMQRLICQKKKQKKNKSYVYFKYMFKEDLALNNIQRLICH